MTIRKLILFVGLLMLTGCSSVGETMERPQTQAETTLVVPMLSESGTACVRIDAELADTVALLNLDGYSMTYEENVWYFEGRPVAIAELEDDPIEACGTTSDINIISHYRDVASERV